MANPVVLLASLFVLLLFCPFPFLLVGPASCNAHSTANACCKPCSPSPFPQKYKASMQLNGSLELEPWIAGGTPICTHTPWALQNKHTASHLD